MTWLDLSAFVRFLYVPHFSTDVQKTSGSLKSSLKSVCSLVVACKKRKLPSTHPVVYKQVLKCLETAGKPIHISGKSHSILLSRPSIFYVFLP